jgi:hypothetical protein
MLTEKEITAVYNRLSSARQVYGLAAELATTRKSELEIMKAGALADGLIEGKNAELREAACRQMFPNQYLSCEDADTELRDRKLALDLAQIEVDRVHDLIRYLSIGQMQY